MSLATLAKGNLTENSSIQVHNDAENEQDIIAQIDGHIEECRSLCQNHLINKRTQQEYEKMWQQLRIERNLQFMSGNSRFLYEAISEAQQYESHFIKTLDQGVQEGWMNEQNKTEWLQRFHDENVLEWDRKKWLKQEFPTYVANWKQVAKDRNDVIQLAKNIGIDAKAIPELNDIINESAFFTLHYKTRVHKVSKVKALLLAKEKQKEQFLQFIEKELESWAHAGWIHSSKVGPWMRRVMESEHPETFASKILYPFKKNWQVARERFDEVGPALKKRKDIRGFTPLKAQAFLLLDYDQRIAYLDEAESRLESDINEEGRLAALRLDIRHAMDTGDWEGAEELLGIAQGMAPDDKAVRSMGRYLATHRTDILEQDADETIIHLQQKGMTALTELQAIMQKIPTNMRVLTEKALHSSNPNTIKRLWQVFYNRHWVIAHGYSSAQQDQMESFKEENYEETEESLANGHGWGFIRRTIKDDTANDAAIRDECVKPQVLYTNGSGLTEVYEGIERNADNATFGYWTTLIDDEVPYDSLREAVLNHMYHIKKNAKILRELGIQYTSYGTPFSLN